MFSRPVSAMSKPAVSSRSALTVPFTITSPLVGNVTPVIIFSAVDFPAPLCPRNATASPFLISKERSLLAFTLVTSLRLSRLLNTLKKRCRSFSYSL